MDLIQAILVGIAIAAIFNGAVASLVLINPRFFSKGYPENSSETNDKAREKDKHDTYYHYCGSLFYLFNNKYFTFRRRWFLEYILDGIHSVEYIKYRRFFVIGLSLISRKI